VAKEISIIFLENLAIIFRKMGNIIIEHSLFIFLFWRNVAPKKKKKKKKKKKLFVIGPRSL
jgi:hypothetical protein